MQSPAIDFQHHTKTKYEEKKRGKKDRDGNGRKKGEGVERRRGWIDGGMNGESTHARWQEAIKMHTLKNE